VQLVSKISNLGYRMWTTADPPTSQTDGRTDRPTDLDGQTDGRDAISIPRAALKFIAR